MDLLVLQMTLIYLQSVSFVSTMSAYRQQSQNKATTSFGTHLVMMEISKEQPQPMGQASLSRQAHLMEEKLEANSLMSTITSKKTRVEME